MAATLLVIHIMLGIALIGVILVQRASSDGGGLTGGGGSSNFGGLMSVRGTANLLTRMTAILAGSFIVTSILLTILAGSHGRSHSIVDDIKAAAPAPTAPATPAAPATPVAPAVPLSK